MGERRLQLQGLKCPLPALHTRRALGRAAPGDRLTVECTDPLSAIDIPHLARETGDVLEEQRRADGGVLVFVLRKRG
jgi:tRNA 2-thiouridine synthesizing protein A